MKVLGQILPFCIALCSTCIANGQTTAYNNDYGYQSTDKNIQIHADPRLDILIDHHKYIRKNSTRTNRGYRVQIYYGTDRTQAINRKIDFKRHHPGIKVYMSYVQPKYRVKVGNFASRADAVELYREMIARYGACMIVPDIVVLNTAEDD